MNRTEANTFADGINELRSLELLQGGLCDAHFVSIGTSSLSLLAFSNSDPVLGRHVGAAVAGLRSSVANRIVDLKAQLGIVEPEASQGNDEPSPAAEAPAPADAEATGEPADVAGEVGAEPQPTTLDAAPVDAEPVAEPAMIEPAPEAQDERAPEALHESTPEAAAA